MFVGSALCFKIGTCRPVATMGGIVAGASSVCIIAECGGSPLLVDDHLNGCGLGLAVMEQSRLLNMRTCSQADFHRALADTMS